MKREALVSNHLKIQRVTVNFLLVRILARRVCLITPAADLLVYKIHIHFDTLLLKVSIWDWNSLRSPTEYHYLKKIDSEFEVSYQL